MAPKTDEHPYTSSLGIKYPTLRDHPDKSAANWLKGKQADDGAEGYWRIYDDLYDFTDFINTHPGGSDWLILTKGTDITEAFECHHLSTRPSHMLSKFHVRAAKTTRNSPFTFKEDGFYKTLKNNVRPLLKDLPKSGAFASKMYIDGLLATAFVGALLAASANSYLFATISSIALCYCTVAAHNFFHQRDNFRMYYFDLSLLQLREWRVSHALSHHVYTNTINDFELTVFEPYFMWLPQNKPLVRRYLSWIYFPLVHVLIFGSSYARRIRAMAMKEPGWGEPKVTDLIPYILPITMYIFSGASLLNCLYWWLVILSIASFHFGFVGVNAAHHHPEIFHDGDTPRSDTDWGLAQLDSVMDRFEINASDFLILTHYGEHAMHHMFPTLDHGQLNALKPIFLKTCKEFGIEPRVTSQLDLLVGQFKQLARIKGNPNPPGHK